MLGAAAVLVVLLVVLALSVGGALSAPETPDPVSMTPARSVVTPQPVQVARPAAPRPAVRTQTARPTPKHSPARDATGQAYEDGMDMARRVAGGSPWSGLVP